MWFDHLPVDIMSGCEAVCVRLGREEKKGGGPAILMDTALSFILIIKGNSRPPSSIHLVRLNDWHSVC